MKEFGIYSITNKINGKMYIGLTTQDFETRWKQHKRSLNTQNHENDYLQKAWNKYGEDGFEFKVIHLCDELDDLSELEKYYIKKYNTYDNGYNLTIGGENSWEGLSEKDRLKLIDKIKNKARENSEYTIKQIENVKIMLSKGHTLKNINIKTGVGIPTISYIKYKNGWSDIRSDLNDVIKENIGQEKRNKNIMEDFYNGMTINQLSDKYKLENASIRYIFKKNNIPFTKINKENTKKERENQLKLDEEVILNILYSSDKPTMAHLKRKTGFSEDKIRNALKRHGVSLSLIKKPKKSEYQSNVAGVRYNNKTNRWFAEIGYEGNVYYIGSSFDELEAIRMRKQAEKIHSINELEKYIKELRLQHNEDLNVNEEMEYKSFLDLKPYNIKYKKKDKRFEVYIKRKYKGSSKVLSKAIEIRDNHLS